MPAHRMVVSLIAAVVMTVCMLSLGEFQGDPRLAMAVGVLIGLAGFGALWLLAGVVRDFMRGPRHRRGLIR